MRLLLFLIICSANFALAQSRCVNLFYSRSDLKQINSADDAAELLIKIEDEFQTWVSTLEATHSRDQGNLPDFRGARELINDAFEKFEQTNLNELKRKITKIQNTIENLKNSYFKQEQARAISDFTDLQNHPHLVIPDKNYTGKSNEGTPFSVSFSTGVVKNVFEETAHSLKKEAILRSFKAILVGQIPNYTSGKNGIKLIDSRNGIFEVAIVGKAVGQFRFLGYLVGQNSYRVVHYYQESDHGAPILKRQIDLVNTIKQSEQMK